jgi:hypothetical protein
MFGVGGRAVDPRKKQRQKQIPSLRCGMTNKKSTATAKTKCGGLSTARQLEAGFGFGGHVIDYGFEVAGFAEDF